MHQLAHGPQEAVDRIGQIAGHLLQPPAIGLRVDPGNVHPAGLQLDHEEDDIPPKTGQGEHLDREEIGGRQTFPVRLQERLPRRALVPLGSRGDPVVVQDPLHRVPGDVVAEVGECAADPRVAPRRILTRHPYDEFGHRPGCHRPSPTPAGTAIVLLGDQPPVPAENRVRRDDAGHLTHDPPAECLASHRESPALGVGQAKRSRTKMLPEDAILLPEIVDAIFLVASHPASQGQHEEVQSVGQGRRLHGSDTAVTHVVSGIHSPRPFSRTIRREGIVNLASCWQSYRMPSYRGYRFPPEIISHAVWLYHRFALSFRDVEDVVARRGVEVTYEAIRKWCRRFGPEYAGRLRRRRGRLGDTWHLDEVFVTIQGRQQYLWRAVDEDGDVLDILVQPRRNRHAAVRFFRKLLKNQRHVPRRLITDKLRSYSAASRAVMPSVFHCTDQYANNRAEASHQPTRQRERQMRRFKSAAQLQRFASVHGIVQNLFRVRCD